jgi:hypothetical protein
MNLEHHPDGGEGMGEDTPSQHESSEGDDEDGEGGEVTPPPHSPRCEAFLFLGDIFSRQLGIAVGACQPKQPLTETGLSTCSPPQPYLALVSPILWGMNVVPVLMKTTHLIEVL